MTTHDIAGLCEKLRAVESSRVHGGFSADRATTNWHRNPDGPPAADTLERQAAEIERLRAAAKEALICAEADVEARRGQLEEWVEYEPDDAYLAELIARRDLIRAALTGEEA
jgi:hypothetical protein